MNKKSDEASFVYFPGKGLYNSCTSEIVIKVTSLDTARLIFETYSQLLAKIPHTEDPEILTAAKTLLNTCQKTITITNDVVHSTIPFSIRNANIENNRITSNPKEINWKKLKTALLAKNYTLFEKKNTMSDEPYPFPIFIVREPNGFAIGEGKAIQKEQSEKSALAETVERIVAKGFTTKNSVCNSQKELFKNNSENFFFECGPRDTFTEETITEWIPAKNISTNKPTWVPTELAYLDYIPKKTITRLFSLHHTTGLSAGSSIEEAAINGLLEVLERDAYWNVMRCRMCCPDIKLGDVTNLHPEVWKVIAFIERHGYTLHLKDFSLDLDVPIAHAMLVSKDGKIPAFAHGSGAALTWNVAIYRAVCEVVQVLSGLVDITKEFWPQIVCVKEAMGNPKLAWSDPLLRPQFEHLIKRSQKKWNAKLKIQSIETYIQILAKKGHECIVAPLGSIEGLEVVRVFVTEMTQPDERLERVGKRLKQFMKQEGLEEKGLYNDPILT